MFGKLLVLAFAVDTSVLFSRFKSVLLGVDFL